MDSTLTSHRLLPPTPQIHRSERTKKNSHFGRILLQMLGCVRNLDTHKTSFLQGKIFMFFWESRLCKEDTIDKLVAMSVFVTGVIYCMLEIFRSVSLLPSGYVTVWFGQQIRRNWSNSYFQRMKSTGSSKAFWNYLDVAWEYIQIMSDTLSSVWHRQME